MNNDTNEPPPSSIEDPDEDEPVFEDPPSHPTDRTEYDRLDNEKNVEPIDIDDDTLVLDIQNNMAQPSYQPKAPQLGEHTFQHLTSLHVLGDLHGWAPGLITYLVEHDLAMIEINGLLLGSGGELDARAMLNLFARDSSMSATDLPAAGLIGRPRFEDCVNGVGHADVCVRWTGGKNTGFVQLGDVIDRADHSELACEILRQLVLDAPANVFVLIGNHEQFVLEDEYDNWYLNENRNAIVDARVRPSEWSRNHLRFMSTLDIDEVERSRLVFESYKESVQLLFLTQGAAQQKSLGIDHGLKEEEISELLSPGWAPYAQASRIAQDHSIKGRPFPGALVAIVIGETLFHHAEPNQKISNLVSEIAWHKKFGWMNYIHGGYNLQASPHSHLLWSRGASDGAALNRPASQAMLEQISTQWPGLYNIVHGHTPTVSIGEFDEITNNESRPVSYLAEPIQSTPKFGRASRIRIYNIDEGLSPVYYKGVNPPEDPCRTPVGLRILTSSNRESPIHAHTVEEPFLKPDKARSVRTDTRKLWVWKRGVYRNNNSGEWKELASNRHQRCVEFDGMMFLVQVSSIGKELLSRNISGYPILKNLLIYLMHEAGILPNHIKRQPPKGALAHVRIQKGDPHLTHMLTPKASWKTGRALNLIAIGTISGRTENTTRMFGINLSKGSHTVHLLNLGDDSKQIRITSETITRLELRHGNAPFCLSLQKSDDLISQKLNHWRGDVTLASKMELKIPICLGLNPLKPFSENTSLTVVNSKKTQLWERPGKTPDVRDSQNKSTQQSNREKSQRQPHKNGHDIRKEKGTSIANNHQGHREKKNSDLMNEKKTPSETESRPSSGVSSSDAESPKSSAIQPHSQQPATRPAPPKPKPNAKPDIRPTRKEAQRGSITLQFNGSMCSDIIKAGKGTRTKEFTHGITVEYWKNWELVTFSITNESTNRDTISYPIRKELFTEPELDWSKIGKPKVYSKSHGMNLNIFQKLIEYVHSLIADELRGD